MTTTPNSEADLNSVIVAAVNARVEAAVASALAGDEVMGRYVTAALQRPVEVPSARGYGKETKPFLSHVIEAAVREAAKTAVQKFLVDEMSSFEDEIRKAVRRTAPQIAERMAGQLAERAATSYGIQVSLRTGD